MKKTSNISPKKKQGKNKKRKSRAKIILPLFTVLMVFAIFTFLIYGGDKVPEKVRNLKGYSYLTGAVKEKLPDQIKLPVEVKLPDQIKLPVEVKLPDQIKIPFEVKLPDRIKLPFELPAMPNPGKLLGDSEIPDKDKIREDLAAYIEDGKKEKASFDSLEIEKRTTVEKDKKDTVYVITESRGEEGTRSNYYRLLYKRHLIGGWKLDEVEPYNVKGEKVSIAGVDNETVIQDEGLFEDFSPDWEFGSVKVVEHFTDLKAGTDTVVVYMELENDYVNMIGTKEIVYQYNEKTKEWEAGSASKLTCLSIEPVSVQQ